MEEFISRNNLIVLNEDSHPTFTADDGGRSVVDLMLCNSSLIRHIGGCRTRAEVPSLSDHQYLTSTIQAAVGSRLVTY